MPCGEQKQGQVSDMASEMQWGTVITPHLDSDRHAPSAVPDCIPWELFGDTDSQASLDLGIPVPLFDKIPGDSHAHCRWVPNPFPDSRGQGHVASTDPSLERPPITGVL